MSDPRVLLIWLGVLGMLAIVVLLLSAWFVESAERKARAERADDWKDIL